MKNESTIVISGLEPVRHRAVLVLNTVDKKSAVYRKTLFVINHKTKKLRIIAGNEAGMSEVVIGELSGCDEDREDEMYSFDADIIADALSSNIDDIRMYRHKDLDHVTLHFPSLFVYRQAYSYEPDSEHLEYIQKTNSANYQTINRQTMASLLQNVENTQKPFEYVQIESQVGVFDSVKTQRDGKVFKSEMEFKTGLGINLSLDEKSFMRLKNGIDESSDEKIDISVQYDKVIIRSANEITLFDIPEMGNFLEKAESEQKTIISFMLNAYKLKDELNRYVKLYEIKKTEQSYLLFHKGKLMICAVTEHSKCAKMIELIDSNFENKTLLYMINSHEFKQLKVKDTTEHHNLMASIIESNEGVTFSLFTKTDLEHPFFSVNCVKVPQMKGLIMDIYGSYQLQIKQQATTTEKPAKEVQSDMFNYAELLDV